MKTKNPKKMKCKKRSNQSARKRHIAVDVGCRKLKNMPKLPVNLMDPDYVAIKKYMLKDLPGFTINGSAIQ